MGIFDSFRKKKPGESSGGMRSETPPKREQPAAGKWQVGDRILDRYEIRDIKGGLGKSGMGIVYIALDHEWNQTFAIKTFQDKFLWNEDAISRFMAEAETWVNLEQHTNIVVANFVQRIKRKPYIFLEYIDGGDLSQYIGRLDIPHALDFAIQFCCGMDYAYKTLGVIHRDIKPGNALVTRAGVLKVTDFGLVKAVGQRVSEEEAKAGDILVSRGMGTGPYMPPEQFSEELQRQFRYPSREVTTRSDIYSFGATFYQVLTGRLPFATVGEIFTHDPPSPAGLNHSIPRQLDSLLLRCLRKDPRERYESFEKLMGELLAVYQALPREQKIFGELYVVMGKKEPVTAARWVNKGISLDTLARYHDAIACYDAALTIVPRCAEAWGGKGTSLTRLGRIEEAITCFERFIELAPSKYEREIRAAEEYIRLLRKMPQKIRLLAPGWEDVHIDLNTLGVLLRIRGANEAAIAWFDMALAINPDDAHVWFNKGAALDALGKYDEAISCYDEAIGIKPGDATAWYEKGNALGALGRPQEAVACFRRFIELAPPGYASQVEQAKQYIRQVEQRS